MAFHHHDGGCRRLHRNHRESIPLSFTESAMSSPCYCGDFSPCCTQPSPPNLDHLLRLIASYLQNQQNRETQCSCKTPSQRFNSVNQQSYMNQQQIKRDNDNLILSCLLKKIDDLDLSLNRFSASYDDKRRDSYSTLKDTAARVIQTHFRSYLVHRSVSLRQLKELATIKSSFLSLKSLVSGKTHFPFVAVSQEATDLLLQLDSIQGRADSMIRDGKRTLCRDLVKFLHYIDDCAMKRRDVVCKSASFRNKCKSSGEANRHVGEDRTTGKLKKQMRTIYGDEKNTSEVEEFLFMTDDAQEIPIVGSSKCRVGEGNKVKAAPVTKTAKFGNNRNVNEVTLSAENDGIGSNSRSRSGVFINGGGRVMKTVKFNEDGNIYKVYGDTPEGSLSGEDDSSTSGSNNEVKDIKYVLKDNEEEEVDSEDGEEEVDSENEEEEVDSENEEVDSENEEDSSLRNERNRKFELRKGSSIFSPPLPLKMEP